MKAIFENRRIEPNELERDKLKFPTGSSKNLPSDYSNLKVKYDKNEDTSLAIKKIGGQTYLTGWKEFVEKNGIKQDYEISLHIEHDNFGSTGTWYRIEVKEAEKRDG